MGTKNTLFIGALLLMGKLSLASSLFIDLQEKNNTTYLITLNGNKTYQTSNDLTINHLNEGNTHLVIEEKTRFNNGWGTTTTNTFLAYDGHVYLPHNTKVNTQLFNNNLSITGSSVLYTPPVTSNPYPTPNPPTCGTPIPQRPPFGQWGQPQAMDDYTFKQLHTLIEDEAFDKNKTKQLRPIFKQQQLTSNQIKQLLALYTFDQHRLEAAKLGFHGAIDPGSYFLVNETFTFSRYKNDLMAYVEKQHVQRPYRGNRNRGGRGQWGNTQQGMNQASFNLLLGQLEDAKFDSKRIDLLETVFKHQNLQSIQVRQLLKTFDFDSHRLDAAKKGYHAVVDPGSYFVVNDTFGFDSYSRRLQDYISEV